MLEFRKHPRNKYCSSLDYFLQNWNDLFEGRSLSRIFIHADSNESLYVHGDVSCELQSQVFQCDLHADLHWTVLGKWNRTGDDLPEQHRKRPHVARFTVNLAWLLLQCFWRHPGRVKQFVLILKRELRISHVDFSRQIVVNLKKKIDQVR